MSNRSLKVWIWLHKWTSLVCTVFMLMLCLTGLPLIFHDEIESLLEEDQALPEMPDGTPLKSLDEALQTALDAYPGERGLFMSFDIDRPVVNVTTGPVARSTLEQMHITSIDLRTAEIVGAITDDGIMHFILDLHTDMFLGPWGEYFLGLMGFLMILAIVSGVVVYTPFMRRLDFGTLRVRGRRDVPTPAGDAQSASATVPAGPAPAKRVARKTWLDLHNLLGIVTVMWLTVVTVTGVIQTISTPLVDLWRWQQLSELTQIYGGKATPETFSSLHDAVATAKSASPGMRPQFVAFPGVRFSSDHHYAVWLRGATPATSQLLTPALIDAETGEFTAMRTMPWYMTALRLSSPLHFGDYGGMPMKVLWAILDILAIVILISGLYLWLGKMKTVRADTQTAPAPQSARLSGSRS
ncbi:MAG TPA: peptidase [Rhodospirillaceae bacterium]|nr:peptidase [Rhodospirillaceae bacterium]MAX65045.1 peptidase [Rhodospirillaceae bacterium]MBB56199.1 peptidase [Rhodospirillaceae bacterium]HAE02500.1 peptidase [Rhodospirillaceae bacterium]|tara:strand:+ start:4647 stop:5879 length:1233 start_codon:yes stop_codon:yes gene_type:complete